MRPKHFKKDHLLISSDKTVIFIDTKKNFNLEQFEYTCNQKNIYFSGLLEDLNPKLYLLIDDHKVHLKFDKSHKAIPLPVNFDFLIKEIMIFIRLTYFKLQNTQYFPYSKKLIQNDKIYNISDSHNLILFNLLINRGLGINKNILYKHIWPMDKDSHFNKLDTHLTNLKNQLIKDLDLKINFHSQDKILKLVIN